MASEEGTEKGVIVHPVEAEASPSSAITIVIADDHQVVRAGLRLLLEAEDGLRGRGRGR